MNTKHYNFQKLTPIKNADLTIYVDALNFVFQESDLKNIAVTGPYSAGKSSIIESYKSKQPNKKFLNISLAHFESVENGSARIDTARIDTADFEDIQSSNATLEGKILNQLIHQINANKIPQSQFKVKRKISKIRIWLTSLLFTIFILMMSYLIGFNSWHHFVQNLSDTWLKSKLSFSIKDSSLFYAGVIGICIFMYALYGLIKIQYNRNMFRKVSVQGNEIEIFADADESFFDKYLNEVLYLFENAEVEVIVFEDIDRFNNNQIFEKLREINLLVNKKSNKVIRFLYLLRDDIFASKDRTKFFDFIIPIVPVVDGSNSYDQFIAHFKEANIFKDFEESFLQGLSLYIDDMRILKNIYNEYIIYHARIQSTELNCNRLLAVVTYKNIFPRDFSELQVGKGFVYNLFENKSKFIEVELKRLDTEIEKHQKEIRAAENEMLASIDELDANYFTTNVALRVNGNHENTFASRALFMKKMKENPNDITYISYNNYGNRTQVNFDYQTEYNKLLQNPEYVERKKALENKASNKIEDLKREISKINKNKVDTVSKKLSEIITKENISEIFSTSYTNEIGEEFSYSDVKSNKYFPLIKFLIRNGYIDETYSDYMTYFYEFSLSRIDKIYLRSVTDEVAKEFSYQLKDPVLVNSRLKEVDFEKEEILNFDLLEYLLASGHSHLNAFILHLKKNNRLDFLSQFWSTGREKVALIKSFNREWRLLWGSILKDSHFTGSQKQIYALETLYHSSEEEILSLNIENCFASYISNNADFLNIEEPNIPVIVSRLHLLKVKLEQINYCNANKMLFQQVYKENLYELNSHIITLILKEIYCLPETEDFKHKNFTLLLSRPHEPLIAYVREKIQQYVNVVLNYCDAIITDEETAALEIINNPSVDVNSKLTYINYLQTVIEQIDSVAENEMWPSLLQHQIVRYSEDNVMQYYFKHSHSFDDALIEFINGNPVILEINYDRIKAKFGETEVSSLYKDIVLCESLSDEKYDSLLKQLNRQYKKFSYSGISDSKLKILIKNNVIFMSKENLLFMRENYPNQVMEFICSSVARYVNEVIEEEDFELTELLYLLEKGIQESYKLRLLAFASAPIQIKGKRYSEEVKLHILEHNFNKEDIPHLISIYNTESSNMRACIGRISIENIDQIVEEQYSVPYNLLVELLKSEIEKESKYELLISHLVNLNEEQAINCLQILGTNELVTLFLGKWPKISRTAENERILSKFKIKGWISEFIVDSHDPSCFRARGRRSRR